MDILHLILNNGYNPIGYGGLGYRPHPMIGGAFELVSYDPVSKRNDITMSYNGGEEATYTLVPTQPTHFLWDAYLLPQTSVEDKTRIIDTIKERQQKFPEKYNNDMKKYLNKLPEDKKEIVKSSEQNLYELTNKYSKLFDKYFPKKKKEKLPEVQPIPEPVKLPKKIKQEQPVKLNTKRVSNNANELIQKFNEKLKTKTHGLENRLKNYDNNANSNNKGLLVKAYQDTIKYGLDLIEKNPTTKTTKISEALTKYVDEMNALIVKGGKYKIENNDLVQIKTSKIAYEFDTNMEPKEAEKEINDYWKDNKKTILKENPDYGKNNNKYIREINESKETVLKNEIPEAIINKALKFRERFPNEKLGYAYMDTIKVGGKLIFKGANKTESDKLKEKEYNSAGKPAEFSICGVDNPLAKGLYKLTNPNMQVSDFIVEDVFKKAGKDTKIGKQFCIDNVDIINQIFSEMKDYKSINYIRCFKLNAQLKEVYYDKLLVELKILIQKYSLEDDEDEKELLKQDIKAYKKTLSDKNEFDKDFYRNRKYIGVGITMNKFTKIEIPDDYDFDESPSTKEQLEKVKSKQGQKFNPVMVDRHITKVLQVRTGKNDKEADFFDKNFNKEVVKKPMKYYITTNFSKVLGTYNYTEDSLVDNDFILGTYKTAYAEDDRDGTHYNAVLIPIEKFDLSY